ncbi:streptophobe family protein [Streptacidiphilus sp. MAP5-3]|uniref:streptophobe family protein n=1 Tax=unclassified Streptacidiphilus TaxID=2643834 RepID=UPI003519079E
MHPGSGDGSADGTPGMGTVLLRSWNAAVGVVVGALLVMAALGAIGLWLARANTLPGDSFGSVLAATMLMALGAPARVQGSAGFIASGSAGVAAMPLTLSLAGALIAGYAFLRPLRRRAALHGRELLGRVLLTAALWAGAVALLAWAARHSFVVSTGNSITDQITGALGASPTVGFRVDVGAAVGYGLLWLAVVLLLAFAVSRAAALPDRLLRLRTAVRPAASAMVVLLLGYVLVALVAGVVTAVVHGPARDTFAVILLALPNLAWLALGLGLGATWHGHLATSIGLPMPKVLSEVLRSAGTGDRTVSLGTLAQQDGRVWWLPVLAGLALLCCGIAMGRTGGRTTAWRHAVSLGLTTALAMLLIGLLTRVSAAYGLSLLGVGGTGGISGLLGNLIGGAGVPKALTGSVTLIPDLLRAVLLGALWGALAGVVGGWIGARLRRTPRDHP